MFIRRLIEWHKDRKASLQLDDQFASVTGHPVYMADREEARAFRKSGMSAHDWIITAQASKRRCREAEARHNNPEY